MAGTHGAISSQELISHRFGDKGEELSFAFHCSLVLSLAFVAYGILQRSLIQCSYRHPTGLSVLFLNYMFGYRF